MSIGFSVLGTILVMNHLSPNNPNNYLDHQPRFSLEPLTNPSYQPVIHHPVDQISPVDLLPVNLLPVDYPVPTLKSDTDADADADAHSDVATDAADTYKIHIKVSPLRIKPWINLTKISG